MAKLSDSEQDAIAAFLKRKAVTQCPDGSAMEIADREKAIQFAKRELLASTGHGNRLSGGGKNRAGAASYAQRVESRMVRKIGTRQLKEKGLTPGDAPLK